MMLGLELIDGSVSVGGELAKDIALSNQPRPNPTVTRGSGTRRGFPLAGQIGSGVRLNVV